MSWFHANEKGANSRDQASVSETLACFRSERSLLFRLALLITGDEATAEESVVNACEITVQGHSPFRDWLTEWAKTATITSALSKTAAAIRTCESVYRDQHCAHGEHLSQGDEGERERRLNLLLGTDPGIVIAELDPLARAVLVLRVAIWSSIQDCVLRANVSRSAVVAANCRAMTWLHDQELKQSSVPQNNVSAESRSAGEG